MDPFLVSALTTLGYSFPELLACAIALAMLWSAARPGKARQLGLIGIGLMLGSAVLQLALGIYQNWVISSAADPATQIGATLARLGAVHMLINCVSLAGLVMISWGLCKATRQADATARTTTGQ